MLWRRLSPTYKWAYMEAAEKLCAPPLLHSTFNIKMCISTVHTHSIRTTTNQKSRYCQRTVRSFMCMRNREILVDCVVDFYYCYCSVKLVVANGYINASSSMCVSVSARERHFTWSNSVTIDQSRNRFSSSSSSLVCIQLRFATLFRFK